MKTKKKKKFGQENLMGFLFILPGFIGFLLFVLFPIVFSLFLSFQDWSFTKGFDSMRFVGFANFQDLFHDSKFITSVINTIIVALITVPVTLALGLIFAIFIKEYTYGQVAVRTMFFLPYVSSIVAVSIVFMMIFHPTYGPVNQFLISMGIENPPMWFADTKWSLISIIILTVWMNIGYYIVVYMAGLTNVPLELYEAAELDGANAINKFLNITLPGVSPTTFFLLIIGLINAFKIFDQVSVTTEGGPGTSSYVLALYIYDTAFKRYEMGYGSAMAWIMFIIIMIITIFQYRHQNKKVDYMM